VPVAGAQYPVDVDLGHPQLVLLVQQRYAALHVGELLDQGADHAIAGAAELGNEFDLAGHAHFAGQVFQKVLHLSRTSVGAHIGQHRRQDIAFTGVILGDEGIGGEILAGLRVFAAAQDEGTHVDIQVLHEAPPNQPVLVHHAGLHQRLAV